MHDSLAWKPIDTALHLASAGVGYLIGGTLESAIIGALVLFVLVWILIILGIIYS